MNWAEYIENTWKSSAHQNIASLSYKDECNQYVLPPISFFTSLIVSQLINKGILSSVIVTPQCGVASLMAVVYKIINDILDGTIGKIYDINLFEAGQKLKLGNCVMEFEGINLVQQDSRINDKQLRFWVKFSDTRYGLPLSAVPFLQKTETNRLSPFKSFVSAKKEINLNDKDNANSELKNFKTFLSSSVFYVGPIISSNLAIKSMEVNEEKLSDVLLLGRTTAEGDVDNFAAGQLSGNSAVIFAPDLYAVNKAISKGVTASAVFMNVSSIISIEAQLDAIDEIRARKIPIILFVDSQDSLELDSLRQSSFLIWSWNASTITDVLTSKDNTKISERLFNCRNTKVKYFTCIENGISASIQVLYSYRQTIEEQSAGIISIFTDFLNISFKMLRNCIPLDERNKQEIKCQIEGCISLLVKERHYISEKQYGDFMQVASYLKLVITDESQNSKVTAIMELLKENSSSDEIILVIDDKGNKNEVQKYWDKILISSATYLKVATVSEFIQRAPSRNDKVIISSWFSKSSMKKVMYNFNANKYYILLYKCEVIWKNAHTKVWEQCSVNDNEQILEQLFNCDLVNENVVELQESLEIDLPQGSDDMMDDIDLVLRESKYRRYYSNENANELIEAMPVNFIGDTIAFFKLSHKLLRLTNAIIGDSDEATEILPKSLQIGDFIAIRDSEKELAREKGSSILENSGRTKAIQLASLWKDALRIERIFSTEEEIYNNLRKAGCTKDRMTVRSWLNDEERIAPREKSDIIAIAIATGDQILLEKADEVFQAAQDIKRANIQAGKYLSEMLRAKIVEELRKYGEIDPYNIWEPIEIQTDIMGTVKILKVIDVGTPILINEANANRLLKD